MNRKVLIIGCPLIGEDFLIGVEQDVRNFSRFVKSSIGGVYGNSEIVWMQHPTLAQLHSVLGQIKNPELLTVYFSGHGFRDDNTDYICLNFNDIFPVKSFLINAKRHLLIMDTCRTPLDTRGYGDAISGIGYHFPTDNPEFAKKLYCDYINESPEGGAIIFSTSENQPSNDTENGGVYTKSLMTVLHNWPNSIDTRDEKIITIEDGFMRSLEISNRYEPTQHPKIYFHKNKAALGIPLAVNPAAHLRKTKSFAYHNFGKI